MNIFVEKVDDETDYMIALYKVTSSTNLRDAAWNIAIGQSIGNPNVRNKWESSDLVEQHCCKILHVEDDLRYQKSGTITIAFPIKNINWKTDGVTQMLCHLMGGHLCIDIIEKCRLIDITLPPNILQYFRGPQFGMSGIRKICNVYNKPLLGGIIKPKTGMSPMQLLNMVKEMVKNGINFIKEDEVMANPDCCPLFERAPLIIDYLRDKKVVYCFCVNGDPLYMLDNIKRLSDMGANGIHINFWAGLGVYKSVREMHLPLFIHMQTSGNEILTCPDHRYSIDWKVLCSLMTISGCDSIHIGMLGENAYSHTNTTQILEIIENLHNWNGVPALSCGMNCINVQEIRSVVGNDFLANTGGFIHGHKNGTGAGVRAMRAAIDKNLDDSDYKLAYNKIMNIS